MKKIAISLLVLLSLSCARKPAAPVGEGGDALFVPLKPSLTKLANGMEVMVLEDHEFPTLQMQVYVKGGALYDPAGKEGLASVAMQTLRLGGAEGRDPLKIEEDLEFVGASLEMGASVEFLSAGLSLMTKDADLGLDILFDLLRKPALDAVRFGIVKERMKDAILRDQEDPLSLASREFPGFVYGPGSAWGRKATTATVTAVTREDVQKFCADNLHPDRLLIAVSGDISEADILAKLKARTEGWEKATASLPEIPPIQPSFQAAAAVIPRKELTQSTVVLGHLGTNRNNPDKFPLLVMNFVLGGSGSLTSRMGEEIRSNAGKAYDVWSDFGFGRDLGVFRAMAQTGIENTDWVVKKIAEMITTLAKDGNVTPEEASKAKLAILRSLVFDFETRFAQVKEQARFRLWGYPDDYLVRFQKGVAAVTPADVSRVAKSYLHPEGLKTLVITDEKEAPKLGMEIRNVE
ncbi:MAG TPA: pitrilysin family protein [bacterium]|nr:pitrilysin family protein [bacterium]